MCLGGHLAYRCALDPRISSAITYFATDLHSHTLGLNKSDDSLTRAKDLTHAELVLIFGKKDNHVPPEGRDLIRKTLHEAGVTFGFYEVAWAQREFFFSWFCLRWARWRSGLGEVRKWKWWNDS
jgi:carboxymethylenebutenolidase